jgi:flagellar assembly protein FliH
MRTATPLSETAVSYDFEQLEPSEPPPRDAPARMIAQASAEADAIREHARRDGHEQGLSAGREEGISQMRSATAALTDALAGVHALREEVAATVERDAIELALALAQKILAATQQVSPESVIDVVQGALRRVGGQRSITILVNPTDLELVRDALGDGASDISQQAGGLGALDLQADQRVQSGGAIVRTAEGEVDAQIETQLERAREVALAELSPGTASS